MKFLKVKSALDSMYVAIYAIFIAGVVDFLAQLPDQSLGRFGKSVITMLVTFSLMMIIAIKRDKVNKISLSKTPSAPQLTDVNTQASQVESEGGSPITVNQTINKTENSISISTVVTFK